MSATSNRRNAVRGVYAISDGPRDDLVAVVDAALRGGVQIFQYRDKTTDASRRLAEAQALCALCRRYGVPFVVNDDIELALAVGADGVHLGEEDADIADARVRMGDAAIIGGSCYDSLQRARQLSDAGADYLAFGAFFTSRSKQTARRATPQLLQQAREFGLPLVAIGGIDASNASPLIEAGADAVAVISALFAASDVEAQARALASLFSSLPTAEWQ